MQLLQRPQEWLMNSRWRWRPLHPAAELASATASLALLQRRPATRGPRFSACSPPGQGVPWMRPGCAVSPRTRCGSHWSANGATCPVPAWTLAPTRAFPTSCSAAMHVTVRREKGVLKITRFCLRVILNQASCNSSYEAVGLVGPSFACIGVCEGINNAAIKGPT